MARRVPWLKQAKDYLDGAGIPYKDVRQLVTNQSKITRNGWKEVFLNAYAHTGSQNAACEIANVDIKTVLKLKAIDVVFKTACDMVKSQAVGKLEKTAFELAVEGERKGIYHQGVKVAEERYRSEKMIQFLLQKMDPDTYDKQPEKDKPEQKAETFDLSRLTKQDIIEIHKILNKDKSEGETIIDAEIVNAGELMESSESDEGKESDERE